MTRGLGRLLHQLLAAAVDVPMDEEPRKLHRQAAPVGRFGGISPKMVARSIVRVGQVVQPVVNLLRDDLLEAPLVFGDETELRVLKEPGRALRPRAASKRR